VGWSNYLVVPKYKLCFEVSRHDGNSTEEYEDRVKDLEKLEALLEESVDVDSITVDDIVKSRKATVRQLTEVVNLAHAAIRLPSSISSTGFFSQLRRYDPTTYLVSELDDAYKTLLIAGYTFINFA